VHLVGIQERHPAHIPGGYISRVFHALRTLACCLRRCYWPIESVVECISPIFTFNSSCSPANYSAPMVQIGVAAPDPRWEPETAPLRCSVVLRFSSSHDLRALIALLHGVHFLGLRVLSNRQSLKCADPYAYEVIAKNYYENSRVTFLS